jgi:hypothetical protein
MSARRILPSSAPIVATVGVNKLMKFHSARQSTLGILSSSVEKQPTVVGADAGSPSSVDDRVGKA